MRPQRFTDFAIDLVKNTPGVNRVQTLTEAGDDKHPWGLAITTAANGEVRWQFVGQLPDGAKHSTFEDVPVTGAPAATMGTPADADSPEAWLAAVLAGAECPEIATVERWSTAPDPGSQRGVTVTFHNAARIFARQL